MGWAAAVGARGQTILPPEDPPPGDPGAYGIINGRSWLTQAAAPVAVTDPGGGVSFTTRSDLQTKIDANPSGTKFVHASGGTEAWTTSLNCGTKNPKIYFLGLAGSTATTIDGQNTSINGFTSTAGSGYEIHGGTFTGFGDPVDELFRAAMNVNGPCVIEDIVATSCHLGVNLGTDGDNTTVRRCYLHSNRRFGLQVSGTETLPVDNVNIEHCRIDNNNTAQLSFAVASGTKFVHTTNSTLRYNWASNNYGWGLWPDGYNENMLITENLTEDNWRGGIFYELSHGGGTVISRNECYRDCAANTEVVSRHTRAALLVSESDGTIGAGGITITRNIVDTAAWPIILFDNDNRSMVTRDVDVNTNDFWLRSSNSRVGGDDEKATKTMHNDATFTWTDNQYHVLFTSWEHWRWPTSTNASEQLSFASWEAKSFTTGETRVLI